MVIDVYSRMVLGFAIYLEKPSAFAAGLAIAHAVLPKEDWLAGVGVQAEWPCWGKMRKIHCDNAKEFRGSVMGRACQDHGIAVEHRPPREPRYGGHIERGFGTWLTRASQPHRSIRFAKEDRRLENRRCINGFSHSKIITDSGSSFANSVRPFAFNFRLPNCIRP